MGELKRKILIWLPSPLGDAILCTPALRAIRRQMGDCHITFLGNDVVREVLSGSGLNDAWLTGRRGNEPATVLRLRREGFTDAILMKNSFGSALSAFLAGIPRRVGYAREGRSLLLTEKLHPAMVGRGRFKPGSMIDYYLALAGLLGADTSERSLELAVSEEDERGLAEKLPEVVKTGGPVVILVPGGAFGPSKCWASARFAETADRLIERHGARVVISVSPRAGERETAREICDASGHELINLGENPLCMGELKALFSRSALVITNDTGPRHIAIALGRKVVTLFGPNDPAWTETGWDQEIQIIGNVWCGPCAKPRCNQRRHFCMEAITVEAVLSASEELLEGVRTKAVVAVGEGLCGADESYRAAGEYREILAAAGLGDIDGVFSFGGGQALSKANLAGYRSRTVIEVGRPSRRIFLKRYDRPPVLTQIRSVLRGEGLKSCARREVEPAAELASAGIRTAELAAYGEERGLLFERRSFVITEEIAGGESLERRLPAFFEGAADSEKLRLRRRFIAALGCFVRRFHETGYRHRDLYFSHIFGDKDGEFHLIDLARAFKPRFFGERYRVKDIAQLYYSAPGRRFSGTDRLRFYASYRGRRRLSSGDKAFIRRVLVKAARMARHDEKHGRTAPFAH